MEANLGLVIEQVGKDKGIAREVLVSALEEAILASAKKAFGLERNLVAEYNEEKGAVDLSQTITVVDEIEDTFNEISVQDCTDRDIEVEVGDEMVFPIYYLGQDAEAALEQDDMYGDILKLKTYRRSFGRIAAQTAKQVIIQRIRDAERGMVFNEYKDRKDELVTGIVRRFERGNIIVDLGRAEAIIPVRQQCPRESYRASDRIQAYVIEVQEHARGPQIVLSRACPQLLVKLFELEVPEIHEGVVKIENAAREPGMRAKIAVSSTDRDVDPVGACVGMKGSRVQAVVQELRGEKIDIVPYSPDPATFVCNALQPAEVSRVLIDEGTRAMEIIVPDDQLSLAIGRKGQNVRLASQLSGWRLDIHSESRIQDIKDRAWKSLSMVEGCNEFLIQTLYNHGIRSAAQLLETDREFLLQFPGIEDENLAKLLTSATEVAAHEETEEQRLLAEAEHASDMARAAKKLKDLLGHDEDARMWQVRGVGESAHKQLVDAGFATVEAVTGATPEELVEKTELGDKKVKQLQYSANQLLKQESEIRARAAEFEITVENGIVVVPKTEAELAAEAAAAEAAAQAEAEAEKAAAENGAADEAAEPAAVAAETTESVAETEDTQGA